jgi:hypothetical protein
MALCRRYIGPPGREAAAETGLGHRFLAVSPPT